MSRNWLNTFVMWPAVDEEEKIQQPSTKVTKIQPQNSIEPETWIEITNMEQLHLPKLFEEEQLFDEDQEEIEIKEHFGYVWKSDTSPPSRLDLIVEELSVPSQQGKASPLELQQKMHVHVSATDDLKDKVISIQVFSSQTGQWVRQEFVPGGCALYDTVTAPHRSYVDIWKSADYWQGSLYVHYDPA